MTTMTHSKLLYTAKAHTADGPFIRRLLVAAVIAIAAAELGMIDSANAQASKTGPEGATTAQPAEGELASLATGTAWLNSPPLTSAGLRGKVVLIDVWTYTCINWLRSLPHVRAWAEKYKDQGLVVIGVHAPEFAFEKQLENVRRAAKEMRVDYPVAIDNEYSIRRAFKNNYWPALYVVDAHGRVRHRQFGEGGYERSERVIQQLLVEAGNSRVSQDLVCPQPASRHGASGARSGRAVSRAHRWPAAGRCARHRRGRPRPRYGDRTATVSADRQPKPIADRQFEIEFLDAGVEAFAFTFG